MKTPKLIMDLDRDYEVGFNSEANHALYKQIKMSSSEIAELIQDTWKYIKTENKSNHILCHFLYLLGTEVEREWINDISIEIIKYGLNHENIEVVDRTIGLIEADSWHDKDILELLYNTDIKEKWLNDYKNDILKDFNYLK